MEFSGVTPLKFATVTGKNQLAKQKDAARPQSGYSPAESCALLNLFESVQVPQNNLPLRTNAAARPVACEGGAGWDVGPEGGAVGGTVVEGGAGAAPGWHWE